MATGFFNVPTPKNEPVKSYAPQSPERAALKAALSEARSKQIEIPMYIGAERIMTADRHAVTPPHDHQHVLGHYSLGDATHVQQAIEAALGASAQWAAMSWEHRASIFLKAADLLAGPYRAEINAATMLGQSKNAYQAEIDAACEMIDFLRFNVQYATQIYRDQPQSS
ncbi:MAG: aldehyde dehydrogenase family protein, partial [Spirosomaceae bacterium]|nr:aldehyde dehydrogenase family protein [Spirosomataceae bacterium]